MTIEKACRKLIISEPFYGLFLSGIQKEVTKDIPTLAVGLKGINVILYINQEFWDGLTDVQQVAVLQHEVLHVALGHLTSRSMYDSAQLFNISADGEINQIIIDNADPKHKADVLPGDCVTIESMEKMAGKALERRAGTNYYYKELYKELGGDGAPQQGDGVGSHELWKDFDNLPDSQKQLVKNQVDHQLKTAAEETMKSSANGIGSIPAELRGLIEKLLKPEPPVFNWRGYFKRVVGNSTQMFQKKNRKRESKRFEEFSKTQIKYKQKILVAIDTSGSINNEDLKDFFTEVHHMYKSGIAIDILECDCSIGRIYEYKGKPDCKITGGGGTSCEPIVEYLDKRRGVYTTTVYFTDGYLDKKPAEKLRWIWLISSDGDHKGEYPGKTIIIPKRKNK
jgi:predicted metal-dependent peptidase